jgi:hypothetical protein
VNKCEREKTGFFDVCSLTTPEEGQWSQDKRGEGGYFMSNGAIVTIPYVLNSAKAVANLDNFDISSVVICSTTHCASSIVKE